MHFIGINPGKLRGIMAIFTPHGEIELIPYKHTDLYINRLKRLNYDSAIAAIEQNEYEKKGDNLGVIGKGIEVYGINQGLLLMQNIRFINVKKKKWQHVFLYHEVFEENFRDIRSDKKLNNNDKILLIARKKYPELTSQIPESGAPGSMGLRKADALLLMEYCRMSYINQCSVCANAVKSKQHGGRYVCFATNVVKKEPMLCDEIVKDCKKNIFEEERSK